MENMKRIIRHLEDEIKEDIRHSRETLSRIGAIMRFVDSEIKKIKSLEQSVIESEKYVSKLREFVIEDQQRIDKNKKEIKRLKYEGIIS